MRKIRDYFFEENEFSRSIFLTGMAAIIFFMEVLLRKIIVAHFFWQDRIYNGTCLLYIYIAISILNIWFVPKWCKNKSLARMAVTGLAPAAAVMSLRWVFTGFITARILLLFMIIYTVYILFQMSRSLMRKKKYGIIGKGIHKLLSVLSIISVIGMLGYFQTGMDPVDTRTVGSVVAAEDGHLWESNRDILKSWKEGNYTELSEEEKESLFQNTIILECQYFGIEPIKMKVENLESDTLMGYYSDDSYTISINHKIFDMPREEVLDTLMHETHHAYIHKAVQSVDWNDKNIEKNKELRIYKDLRIYKRGIENYVSADVNQYRYYYNPIETAAREYAQEWGPKLLEFADSIKE